MKIRYILVITLALLGITSAFAQDTNCPICPPPCDTCTNDPGTNYTYTPPPPQEFPTNALLLRQASISTGGIQIYTNYGWTIDTNTGNIIGAGASPYDNSLAGDFTYYDYLIAVTNATVTNAYVVQFTTNLVGPWQNVSGPFTGNPSGAEYNTTVQFNTPLSPNGFFRVAQLPGFVIWANAGPTGAVGGSGSCPGPYVGYLIYTPVPFNQATNSNWGWALNTNAAVATITDLSSRNDVRVEYGGAYGDEGCGSNNVSFTIPGFSPYYRFATYFRNSYPTNQNWPLWLQGFLVNTNNP